jgi:RNA polymerase sigma-70 factor (ECF subfamily)
MRRPGPYQLQAAVAALHDEAATADETDWSQILALYDSLARQSPSPVVELNRAVAVAMVHGPAAGLGRMDVHAAALDGYPYLHAARADLLRRLGRYDEARAAYERAAALTTNEPERTFLIGRIAELAG